MLWRLRTSLLALVLLACMTGGGTASKLSPHPDSPILCIDGLFDDWHTIDLIATDSTGDASGAFDITEVSVTSRGSRLYLRFDTGQTLNLHNGPDSEGTLLIELGLPTNRRITIDTRGRKAWLEEGDDHQKLSWTDLNYSIAPTIASSEFELSMNLSRFGVRIGDMVTIQFGGSDKLDRVVQLVLTEEDVPPIRRSAARQSSTDIRVANLNTLRRGLRNSERSESIGRLLRAVEADIYMFQEEQGSTDLDAVLGRLMPSSNEWHVYQKSGCVIATRLPLTPIPSDSQRFVVAGVELPSGKQLIVVSVHLKCCGYAGSKEDITRISQAKQIADLIGSIGAGYDGVIVIGDFNLVGSGTTIRVLADPDGADLKQSILSRLDGQSVQTWRSLNNGRFPSGRLDTVMYSPGKLIHQNGFVLDTVQLSQAERQALDVRKMDSRASDHLMLVADFALSAQ